MGLIFVSKKREIQGTGKYGINGGKFTADRLVVPGTVDRMKAFAKIFCWASIAGAVLLYPAVSVAEVLGAMRVRLVSGDVQVKISETGEWVSASVNLPLVERDELWIPEGSLSEIQTNNGAYVRLDGNTALQVLRADRDSFQFYLPQGRVYVMNDVPTGSVLQFDTPDTSIRAFEASTFRIDIPNGETDLLVLRGSVTAENVGGATRVRAGSMLLLGANGYAELSPLPPPDVGRSGTRDGTGSSLLATGTFRRNSGCTPATSTSTAVGYTFRHTDSSGIPGSSRRATGHRTGREGGCGGAETTCGSDTALGVGPLPLRTLVLCRPNRLVLGASLPGRRILGAGIRGLGQDRELRGVGSPRSGGYLLRTRKFRPAQRESHEREHQAGPGDQRIPEHQFQKQHHSGRPDDVRHGAAGGRQPEREGESEGRLRTASQHRRGKTIDQTGRGKLPPCGTEYSRGEAPAGNGPEDKREATEEVPSDGQGTRPFRNTAARQTPPVGDKAGRETEVHKREDKGFPEVGPAGEGQSAEYPCREGKTAGSTAREGKAAAVGPTGKGQAADNACREGKAAGVT